AKYQAAVVLCDLEGRRHKKAARQLGWPEGTLSSRLARGRALLARRLLRRGVVPAGAAAAAALAPDALAAVPARLAAAVAHPAVLAGAARGLPELIPLNVSLLTQGALRAMMLSKMRVAAILVLSLGLL